MSFHAAFWPTHCESKCNAKQAAFVAAVSDAIGLTFRTALVTAIRDSECASFYATHASTLCGTL